MSRVAQWCDRVAHEHPRLLVLFATVPALHLAYDVAKDLVRHLA